MRSAAACAPPNPLSQMGAQRMGFFTRAEFKQGLTECGATSVAQLRKALPRLADVDGDPHAQEALHQWAFRYCLTVGRVRAGVDVPAC